MGTTWHTPSSTQTGRAGFWNSVRRVLSPDTEELLLVNQPNDGVWVLNLPRGGSVRLWMRCGESALLCLTSAASLNVTRIVSSQRGGLKFWWFSSAWRGLWSELLIKWFSSFSLCLSSPALSLSLRFFPVIHILCCCCCLFLRRYVPSQKQWIRSTVTVFPVGTPSPRMSSINSGALCCFRRTCENLEAAMVYSHRQLPLLLWVHHSKCWSTSISNISSGFHRIVAH